MSSVLYLDNIEAASHSISDDDNDTSKDALNYQKENSIDRTIFSAIIVVEHSIMMGLICASTAPYDLKLWIFIPSVSAIFLLGQILEWRYHMSYPFSETHEGYTRKNYLFYVVLLVISVTALLTTLVITFNYKYAKIFTVFIVIVMLSLLALFLMSIVEGLKKIVGSLKGSTNKD